VVELLLTYMMMRINEILIFKPSTEKLANRINAVEERHINNLNEMFQYCILI
jgi:hypothetical protein